MSSPMCSSIIYIIYGFATKSYRFAVTLHLTIHMHPIGVPYIK